MFIKHSKYKNEIIERDCVRKQGAIIISLDFELYWGVHDVLSLKRYQHHLLGARKAIPQMLELFKRFDIHATWATVGLLFFDHKKEMITAFPPLLPSYVDVNFSPYEKLKAVGENEQLDPYHFGLSLIKQIANAPHQEIGTHTFSHYYCLEEGQSKSEFHSDLKTACDVATAKGITLKSIVFPRNQTNPAYFQVVKKHGIQCYRGNENRWVYKESRFHSEGKLKRMLRLMDSYVNIFGHHTYPLEKVETKPLVNLPSSCFLRPYQTKFKVVEQLRLRRIKKSLTYAAKKGEVFHLWWHPHNFGKDIEENIQFLTKIFEHVSKLQDEYGFTSLNMEEASSHILQLTTERSVKLYYEQPYT